MPRETFIPFLVQLKRGFAIVENMKFFVTGRSSNIDAIKSCMAEICEAGHEVVLDWTVLPMVKPYHDNPEQAGQYATDQIAAIAESDVYILLAHHDGTGVFAELGSALTLAQLHGKPLIYAVAREIPEAMFHYHPAINWCKSVDEVFTAVGAA